MEGLALEGAEPFEIGRPPLERVVRVDLRVGGAEADKVVWTRGARGVAFLVVTEEVDGGLGVGVLDTDREPLGGRRMRSFVL